MPKKSKRELVNVDDISNLPRAKVKFEQHKNRILNAKATLGKSILLVGKELNEVKENCYYQPYYKNFKDYCINEIDIAWQTAYDYIKIFKFIENNKDALPMRVAKTIGHRSLKFIVQKLSKIEEQQRKNILNAIEEYEHYEKIKNKIAQQLHRK